MTGYNRVRGINDERNHNVRFHLAVLTLIFFVAACGGGGGGGESEPVTQPTPSDSPPAESPDADGAADDSDTPSTAPFLLDQTTRSLAAPAVSSNVADAVMTCTVMLREDETCSFNDLPLLGMQTVDPTIDDVMERVVATHDWMATRFRQLLTRMPDEVLLMMRGLTGVVISSDIRPSFYTARTGAIYLDPQGMWLTEEERAVISTEEDPRAEDIRRFKFRMLWRYVKDDTNIRAFDRSLESLSYRTAALLYHELAHANDFFPPDRLDTLDRTIPIFDNISSSQLPSTELANSLPLMSTFMDSLARAAFNPDIDPTESQLETTAEEVADAFPGDIANDYYNYSTDREDLAMAFEEALMLHTLGIHRDVGIVNQPEETASSCNEFTVVWGQRNRIAESGVGPRSVLAVERVLPEAAPAIEEMIADLPPPSPMQPNRGWCANISLDSDSASRALTVASDEPVEGNVEFLPIAH